MALVLLFFTLASSSVHAETPGVVGQLEQSATTSPKEKVAFSEAALVEINAAVKTVEKLLEEATKEGNDEEVECLTRKLTPLRALNEVSRQSNTAMQAALSSSDSVHADMEFRKIAVALTKSRDFLAEAQSCVGDSGARRGEAAISVAGGETSLVDDTDLVDPDFGGIIGPNNVTPQ